MLPGRPPGGFYGNILALGHSALRPKRVWHSFESLVDPIRVLFKGKPLNARQIAALGACSLIRMASFERFRPPHTHSKVSSIQDSSSVSCGIRHHLSHRPIFSAAVSEKIVVFVMSRLFVDAISCTWYCKRGIDALRARSWCAVRIMDRGSHSTIQTITNT